jgi:Protein of unknown function (DUF2809)
LKQFLTPVRQIHAVLIAITVPLGFVTRMTSLPMPALVRDFGGDVLSATCIYFGVRFILETRNLWQCGAISFIVCVLIELQQLITWEPLLRLREDTPMDILLGHGFLWSDLVCYAVGVLMGLAISRYLESRERQNP